MIDSGRRRAAVLLFGIGIPAYVALGIVFLLGGLPTPAYVLLVVAVVDAFWLLGVLRV